MIWRPVCGYTRFYEVSEHGDVRRLARRLRMPANRRCRGGYTIYFPGRVLRPFKAGPYKYLAVTLARRGVNTKRYIAHLVAEAFIGRRVLGRHVDSTQVNHKDGDRYHNHWTNLAYVTHAENHAHAARTGLSARGERNGAAKLTADQVRRIRQSTDRAVVLAATFHVALDLIYQIRRRNIWKHVV